MKKDDSFEYRFTIDEEMYMGFIRCFNDRNPLHTDRDFARSKGFGDKVMHGNILNGVLSFFIGECLPEKNVIIHKQDIKFSHPVYLGDQLLLSAVITDVFESVNSLVFKFFFINQAGKKVAAGSIQIGRI